MAFLEKADLTSIIYEQDIDTITDGDDDKVTTAIDAAIGEAMAYCDHYDTDTLFERVPPDRDPILFESCKAIACWYLIAACPANQDTKDIEKRADFARSWLGKVQRGTLKPKNWPVNSPAERATFFHVSSSSTKRNNDI